MKHLLFDTETTNLIQNSLQPLHKQPKVIEFFGLMLDDTDWSEIGTLHSYISPGVPISAEVTKITGITDAQVKGAPEFREFAPRLEKFFAGAHVAVAHNLSYDLAVLNFEFQRLGGKLVWPPRRVCTVEATEHLKGFRLSLTALHTELFGEGFAKAHSAEHDVRAMARCYITLTQRGEI
jgi:DNA polymerase III subunit epsilon